MKPKFSSLFQFSVEVVVPFDPTRDLVTGVFEVRVEDSISTVLPINIPMQQVDDQNLISSSSLIQLYVDKDFGLQRMRIFVDQGEFAASVVVRCIDTVYRKDCEGLDLRHRLKEGKARTIIPN